MANQQENNCAWYVYATDANAIKIIFSELEPRPSPTRSYWVEDMEYVNGPKLEVRMSLIKLDSYEQLEELRNKRQDFRPPLRIYVQDNPGDKIYRWPEDGSLPKVKRL